MGRRNTVVCDRCGLQEDIDNRKRDYQFRNWTHVTSRHVDLARPPDPNDDDDPTPQAESHELCASCSRSHREWMRINPNRDMPSKDGL